MLNNTFKYINHTKEEIEEYLRKVKECINVGKFVVCTTVKNEKNRKFIERYNLNSNKQKEMLVELEVKDFCYSVDNYNNPNEKLYIFCREYELNNWGIIENVDVYIKVVIKQNNFIVIISFHKLEKNIKRLFV